MKDKVLKLMKGISLRFLVVAGIFVGALMVFTIIADEMVLENENRLDTTVFHYLKAYTNPSMTQFMVAVTFFGSPYFLAPAFILLILYFLLFEKNKRLAFEVTSIGLLSTLLLFSIKAIFHRHRPLDPLVKGVTGFSFPSGHTLSSFTFCGLLIYIIWKENVHPVVKWTVSILLFLLACSVAISRVYLHVHYASDVVAGFCLCLVWLIFSFFAMSKLNGKIHRPK
jgi:undecaprenyl-diphosphatase